MQTLLHGSELMTLDTQFKSKLLKSQNMDMLFCTSSCPCEILRTIFSVSLIQIINDQVKMKVLSYLLYIFLLYMKCYALSTIDEVEIK